MTDLPTEKDIPSMKTEMPSIAGSFLAYEVPSPMLLTPGPLALSPDVKARMLTDLGSRSTALRTLTRETRSRLCRLTNSRASHEAILLQGSGTFATEAALTTFCGPTSKSLVLVNGNYGQRMVDILKRQGMCYEALTFPFQTQPDLEEVARVLKADKRITHLLFVHCETTTGILNPAEQLCALAAKMGVLSVVDAMSSFGAVEIDRAKMAFDILISSGNKAVEAPPGIAFALVDRALLRRGFTVQSSFCLDLYDQWRRFEADGEWRSTPPTHVLQALHAAIEILETEGVASRRARYERVQERVLEALLPWGFKPVVALKHRSPICVAFQCPAWADREDIAFRAFCEDLEAVGLHIYTKMDQETKSFRIGCIGQIETEWIELFTRTVAAHCAKQRELAS